MIIHWDEYSDNFTDYVIFETKEDWDNSYIPHEKIYNMHRLDRLHTVAFGDSYIPEVFPFIAMLKCGGADYSYHGEPIRQEFISKIFEKFEEQKESLNKMLSLKNKFLVS